MYNYGEEYDHFPSRFLFVLGIVLRYHGCSYFFIVKPPLPQRYSENFQTNEVLWHFQEDLSKTNSQILLIFLTVQQGREDIAKLLEIA